MPMEKGQGRLPRLFPTTSVMGGSHIKTKTPQEQIDITLPSCFGTLNINIRVHLLLKKCALCGYIVYGYCDIVVFVLIQ